MGYKEKVFNDQNIVDVSKLDFLTMSDWKAWMKNWFIQEVGDDPMSKYWYDENLYEMCNSYRNFFDIVDGDTEQRIDEAVTSCLDEVFDQIQEIGFGGEWDDRAFDGLLSFIQNIQRSHDYSYHKETIRRFLDIVEPEPEKMPSEDEFDHYARVLQTLVGVGADYDPPFWEEQLDKCPEYFILCFAGALKNSPQDGLKLLDSVDWENESSLEISSMMPHFFKLYGEDEEIMAEFDEKTRQIPEQIQSDISLIFNRYLELKAGE